MPIPDLSVRDYSEFLLGGAL